MNFIKHFFFMEASSLINKGKKQPVVETDVLPLPAHLDPRNKVFPEEKLNWSSPRRHLWSVIKVAKKETGRAYFWYLISIVFSLSTPWLVNRFVSLISAGVTEENLITALVTGILLGFCGIMSGLCMQHYFYHNLAAYQIMTNILNKRIFSHSLRLSLRARQKNQVGDVVNYMSSDSESVADFTFVFGELAASALMITGVVSMLFYFIGWSALAALTVLFTLAPLTQYVAKRFTKLDEEMMAFRDRRVTMMTQALNAIRVVKYFAWEKSVAKEVQEIRDQELHSRRKLARSEVLSGLAYVGVSSIVLFVALATHAWRGEKLDAALIFTCVSLFGLLESPFGELSHLISRFTNGYVGAGRILNFLKQEELPPSMAELDTSGRSVGVRLKELTAYYEEKQDPVLKGLDQDIPPGSSMAIVGPVGSGKSSLLLSIFSPRQA